MTDSRQAELLLWASQNAREPWDKMVEAFARVYAKKRPTHSKLSVPLTPFTADPTAVYNLMRTFGGLITWSPGNLFTLILDADEKTILRAYIEVNRDGNFVKMIPVHPTEPFLQEALQTIRSGDLYTLRRDLDAACKTKFKQPVNWVKIANIEFFGAFKKQCELFEKSNNLWDWVAGAFSAVQQIYKADLIRFTPEPPVFARLRELMTDILRVDPSHLDLPSIFWPIQKDRPAPKEWIVLLADHKTVTGLSFGGDDPFNITLDSKITDQLQGMPFHLLAKGCRRLTHAKQVIALRAEPVSNLVYEVLYNPMPYEREVTKTVVRKLLEIVRRFREQWTMHPLPFYLHDRLRYPAKWLGNPFDINSLASWFLPGMIIDGEAMVLGQHNIRTFVTLDGEKILAMYTIEVYDGGIRKVQTHDPNLYSDMFTNSKQTYADTRERAIQLGIRLWNEGHGFQNQVMITQVDFLKTLGEMGAIRTWRNPLRLHRLIGPIRRLIRRAKQGAVVLYPDQMLIELERWVNKVGRVHIYRQLAFLPFDRKKPRSRGLKYIKVSVAAGLFMALAGYLWFG